MHASSSSFKNDYGNMSSLRNARPHVGDVRIGRKLNTDKRISNYQMRKRLLEQFPSKANYIQWFCNSTCL